MTVLLSWSKVSRQIIYIYIHVVRDKNPPIKPPRKLPRKPRGSPLADLQLHTLLESVQTEWEKGPPPVLLVSIDIEDREGILVVSVVEVVGLRYELAPIPGREETISDTIDDVIGEGNGEKVRKGRKGVHVLMKDEKEERKKHARSNKQQGKATQHTQGSRFSMYSNKQESSHVLILVLGYSGCLQLPPVRLCSLEVALVLSPKR